MKNDRGMVEGVGGERRKGEDLLRGEDEEVEQIQ